MRIQRSRLKLSMGSAVGILLLAATAALAGKPVKGATYTARTAKGGEFSLKVSSNGKRVTVDESLPPLYCQGGAGGIEEVPKPLAISKSGSFKGTISYRVIHGKTVAKLTINGTFVDSDVTGKMSSKWLLSKGCNGTTPYSAAAVS